MPCRSDVLVSWQAANASTPLNAPGEESAAPDLIAAMPAERTRTEGEHGCFFSLIVCDADEDPHLENTLASLLDNDLSLTQVIVAATRRREAAVTRILDKIGAPAGLERHVIDGVDSFAEREASALRTARGTFIGFLVAGDRLAGDALSLLGLAAQSHEGTDILYTDEEWIDEHGGRRSPRLKTGWDPDAQLGRDLFGQLCLLRRSRVTEAGGLRPEHAPAHHYDLHCRVAFSVSPTAIRHLPLMLCRRAIPRADADGGNGENFLQAAREVARLVAQRLCGQPVTVTPAPLAPFINRIHWPLPERPPLVSILVPTRDHADLVRNCVEGLLTRTTYDNFEVLILDNGSAEPATFRLFAELQADRRVRVVPEPGPFNFSRINNEGVRATRGEILVFLNNDIEVIADGWLHEMVAQALRPDVGCVGARLLYGDRHVQHDAGEEEVVLRPGPLAMHVFRRRHAGEIGSDARLAGTRTYVAVTAACLAVRRSVFDRVGGFDEVDLPVSFQDVDLCLKIGEIGYRNICTPFEPLLHLEGSSRGSGEATPEKAAFERRQLTCLLHRWGDRFHDDSFGHPRIRLDWEQPERLVPLPQGVTVHDLVR